MKQFFGMHDHYTGAYYKSDYSDKIAIYANDYKDAIRQLHKGNIVDKWHFNNTSCDCCGWVDCSITYANDDDLFTLDFDDVEYIVHNSKLYTVSDFAKSHPVIFAKFYNEVNK